MLIHVVLLLRTFLCLGLGFLSGLIIAFALPWWYPQLGRTVNYSGSVPSQPEWRFAVRETYLSQTVIHVDIWKYSVTPLPDAAEVRASIREVLWKAREAGLPYRPPRPNACIEIVEWGWPWRSAWGMFAFTDRTPSQQWYGLLKLSRGPAGSVGETWVPYAPQFVGLTLNTLFWSLPWWLVFVGADKLRRWNRLRRHHCPACNYNLTGLAPDSPCPECGGTS